MASGTPLTLPFTVPPRQAAAKIRDFFIGKIYQARKPLSDPQVCPPLGRPCATVTSLRASPTFLLLLHRRSRRCPRMRC